MAGRRARRWAGPGLFLLSLLAPQPAGGLQHLLGQPRTAPSLRNRCMRRSAKVLNHITKNELFSRLVSQSRDVVHDDIVIRSRTGDRYTSIPQAERYRSSDWTHILRHTPSSLVLKRIREPVIVLTAFSAVIALAQHLFHFMPSRVFSQPHGLTGSALGLLLVFRTNAAYNRFWEGRIIWEKLLGESRSLARLTMLYEQQITSRRVKRIANLICAFAYVLQEHLGSRCKQDYSHLISREDKLSLDKVGNRPLCITNKLGREIREIRDQSTGDEIDFSSRERLSMLKHVNEMCNTISSCERLVQTPVPLNYARHTSRFMTIWCLTMPFALVGELGFMVVPIMGLITWGLFGIQEIGLMIEEPFRRSLRLDVITSTIYADVQETTYMTEWEKRSKKEKKSATSSSPAPIITPKSVRAVAATNTGSEEDAAMQSDEPAEEDGQRLQAAAAVGAEGTNHLSASMEK